MAAALPAGDGPASIISSKELQRIRRELDSNKVPQSHAEKNHLRQLSKERASHWPNTIEALRARKEQARKEKLEQEEAERCKMDVIEAARRGELRRQQIERANKMLHDEIDRVKVFHSKLLLSDILQEREAQIQYKDCMKALEKKQEEMFVMEKKKELREAEDAEAKAVEERRRHAMEQKEIQLAQLEEMKAKIMREQDEDREEGLRIRNNAEAAAEESRQKEQRRRQAAVEANLGTLAANEVLKTYKQKEKERETEELERIKDYALMLERREQERRASEAAKAKQKAESQDQMIAKQEQILLAARKLAAERLERHEKEMEERKETREKDDRERRQKEWEAMDRSRKLQLYNRHRNREAAREEDKEQVRQWKERALEVKEEQKREKQMTFERNLKLAQNHRQTAKKKLYAKEKAKVDDILDYQHTLVELEEDEASFQAYAKACIDEWASHGKNTKPMELSMAQQADTRLAVTKALAKV